MGIELDRTVVAGEHPDRVAIEHAGLGEDLDRGRPRAALAAYPSILRGLDDGPLVALAS